MAKNAAYYQNLARQAAAAAGIDASTFVRQINQESGFNPGAGSSAGARGIAQIMPTTAQSWGVDPMNPRDALYAAAKHMAGYLHNYKNDWSKALAAYNAGPGAVAKYGGVPPFSETQAYVKAILGGKNPPLVSSAGGGAHRPGGGKTAAPGPAASGISPADTHHDRLLEFIFAGSPFEQNVQDQVDARAREALIAPESLPGASSTLGPKKPSGGAPTRSDSSSGGGKAAPMKSGEAWWHYLQRMGHTKFGLSNDPGNSQTTGGKHVDGSEHYSGRAVDFGDARNSWKQLNAWASWAKSQGYDVLNEGNHIHVSAPGSGT